MTEHFCTYFDHRYAVKGLAMWRSLRTHHRAAALHVLCLSEACHAILDGLQLPDVHLYRLHDLELAHPDLLSAKRNRSLVEYYFTLTPYLPLHILEEGTDTPRVTYVDADLYFFADPRPILDEIGPRSIGLVEHRFPDSLSRLAEYGRFNVGWLTFANDECALSCLRTWRQQCLDWCYDRLENNRFAEQKYLDDWPSRCCSVAVIQHKGANLAPWNLDRFELTADDDGVRVDDEPLLFFHAHGFEPASPGRLRNLNLKTYGVEERPVIVDRIYGPYEQALVSTTSDLAVPVALALAAESSRSSIGRIASLENRIAALEDARAASEADRAARLYIIEALQEKLDASEADRAARLAIIETLQEKLDASEADRAARLELIHELQRELDARQAQLETARAQLQQTAASLAAVQNSRSWRWTRPVRSVLSGSGERDA
jgi:hypothetical protein